MKKLTKEQLRKLKVYNTWEFCQVTKGGWFLSYSNDRWAGGWKVIHAQLTDGFVHGKSILPSGRRNATIDSLRVEAEPTLNDLGILWPTEMVKCDGAWMDKAFYEARMADLVSQYKKLPPPA